MHKSGSDAESNGKLEYHVDLRGVPSTTCTIDTRKWRMRAWTLTWVLDEKSISATQCLIYPWRVVGLSAFDGDRVYHILTAKTHNSGLYCHTDSSLLLCACEMHCLPLATRGDGLKIIHMSSRNAACYCITRGRQIMTRDDSIELDIMSRTSSAHTWLSYSRFPDPARINQYQFSIQNDTCCKYSSIQSHDKHSVLRSKTELQ